MSHPKDLPPVLNKMFHTLGTNNSSEIATAVLAVFKFIFIPIATACDKKATPEQKKYTTARDMITEGLAFATYLGVTNVIKNVCSAPLCKNYYARKAKLIEQGKIKGISVSKNISKEDLEMLKNIDTKALKETGMKALGSKITVSEESKKYMQKLEAVVDNLSKNWAEHSKLFKKPDGFIQKIYDAFDSKAKIVSPNNLFKDARLNLSQLSVYVLALLIIPAGCNLIMPPIMKLVSSKKDKGSQPKPAVNAVESVNIQKGKDVNFGRNYYNNMPNLGNMRVG